MSVFGLSASGTLMVGVSNGGFTVSVPSSNPVTVSFFGLGGFSAYGFISSNGQFSLTGSVGFDLGSGGNELYGSISVAITNAGLWGTLNGGATVFGVNLASVSGSLVIESGYVHLGATVYVIGIPFSFDFNLGALGSAVAPNTVYWYSVPTNVNEGDTITLDAGATDGSGNNLGNGSYSWSVTQNGAAFASGTGAALPVTFGDPGTYVVTLYAGPLVRSSTITVANIPPTIVSMNVPTALASGITQTFTPTITDPGKTASNGGLTYYWTLTRNGSPFSQSGPVHGNGAYSFSIPAPALGSPPTPIPPPCLSPIRSAARRRAPLRSSASIRPTSPSRPPSTTSIIRSASRSATRSRSRTRLPTCTPSTSRPHSPGRRSP